MELVIGGECGYRARTSGKIETAVTQEYPVLEKRKSSK